MARGARSQKTQVVELRSEPLAAGPKVGRITSAVPGGPVLVRWSGAAAPVPARVAAPMDAAGLERAAREGQEALLVFEDGRLDRPILVALLASVTPQLDALLASPSPAAAPAKADARLDGRRVVVEAGKELVLRCGKASLTMTEDGKVSLRGFQIVTQADGVQKIRGAKVQIN